MDYTHIGQGHGKEDQLKDYKISQGQANDSYDIGQDSIWSRLTRP